LPFVPLESLGVLVRLSRQIRRPALALVVVGSLTALALPAGAATATPAKGTATSSVTVLRLTISGTTITAGQIAAVAANATKPHQAKLVVTPLDSSATGPVGQQTVTPSSGASTVPTAPASAALPSGLGSVTGPTFAVDATDNATGVLVSAALKALGSVKLLTVPINLKTASLSDVAKVTSTQSSASKTLSLGSLSLPSLNDLLASLGVDLNALLKVLPQAQLTQLAGLVTSTTSGAVKTANAAVDSAQAAVGGSAPQALDGATSALTAANGTLTTAKATLTTATAAFTTGFATIPALTLTGLGVPAGTTADQFLALAPAVQSALDAATGADLSSLSAAVKTAETAVTTAQAAVDALQALVTALTNLLNAVLGALTGNSDPLAALGNIKLTTSAVAAKTPKADAAVSVGSINVLGSLTPLTSLTTALDDVMNTLSGVLNSVTGVSFTPAKLAIGQPTHSTSTKGKTTFATASVTGLTLTLPSITLPQSLTLAGVPTGISGSLSLGALTDTAQFTPGTAATPSTPNTPTPSSPHTPSSSPLPNTGGNMLLPVAGLLILGTAVLLRRRLAQQGGSDTGA
jgi:LPXTG-motif cell wall-anchored protein